ncbi:FecCD family ABC transporter permease [Sporosalibacterium faouarense]|uniref:FecCD family ABC transporter permease n=1 Tax=Sporosalibacterium faouarense TaxID=516123 RepID=UPI00192C96E7|nr:iron chelate uptake ABC transporter family permease subunit [Sporosalibacterium faouarense]
MVSYLKKKNKWIVSISFLIIFLVVSIAVFVTIGSASITVLDTVKIIISKIPVLKNLVDINDLPRSSAVIVLNIRIPRVLLGVLVGAALSTVGAAFQGMFKNPMADPYVIGISSGAALGATLAIIGNVSFLILGISETSLGAFIGAITSTFVVYMISRVKNKIPVTVLLLSGIAIGQFFTAIMSFIMVIHSNDLDKIIYWTLGSFSGKGWDQLISVAVPIIISIVVLNFFARDLNAMLTGEETAQNLGIEVEKVKLIILIIGAFLTAMAVSVSGIIGFVGLIIPHIVRLIVGSDHRILMPASAMVGGIFMIFADTLARTMISPTEIPVGIITAMFGGPFFIYLLRKKRKSI